MFSNLTAARLAYQRKMRELKKKQRKTNKYNAKVAKAGGRRFDSEFECSVYAVLQRQERVGEITNLRHQHQVRFTDAGITWRLDFSFTRDGAQWFAEAKGLETEAYLIKKKLWRVYGIGPLEIWRGTAANPRHTETIIPTPLRVTT